jgi:tRNA(fMet)-specific endonuclease VapC
MTARYMLDTNICIYLMKHQPPQVRERFAQCFVGDVVISSITLSELSYGVACSGAQQALNQRALELFLKDIEVAPYDTSASWTYGPLRFAHPQRKAAMDKLIAAHAKALNVILVTNNEADFCIYEGLRVENWVK